MARLVTGVIDAARDYHPSFDPKRQPSGPLYRMLATFCAEMQAQIMAIDSATNGFEVTLSYALPLGNHDAGLALGANRLVTDIVAVDPSTATTPGTTPIPLILREQRHARNAPRLFAWQEGERLYLRGPASHWNAWNNGSIQVRVVQAFGDVQVDALQDRDAVLPLPESCADAAAAYLAFRMGFRSDPPLDFGGVYRDAKAAALLAVAQRLVGTTVFTQDDWSP